MKEKKESSSYLREALEQNFPQYQEDKNAFGIAADALEEYERKGILSYEDIVEHFLHDGRLQYEGFQVRDAHSLALLLQTFRNVQFETFRMVYTKGDTIAAITGVESRLPHLSFTMPEKSISKGFYNMQRRMERLGADGFYMVHNHPTGDVLPSADDTNETMRFAQNLPGFRGHIILDHTKYSVLDENGVIGIYDIPEDYQNPLYYETETFLIGTKVRNSDEVAAFFDHLNPAPERSLLVLTTAKGSIRTFEEVSNKVILHDKNFKNYIRNEMVRNGCTHAFLATQSEEIYDSCRPLVIDRYLMDAVFLDEIGMESVNRWMHEHNVERNKEIEWAGLHLEKMHRDKNNSGKMPTSLLREEISPYEFEQEVKSMNMTAEEFLEEMRVYFAGEKEAMSTDGLIFTDEVGADIELQVSNLKDCYWEIFESSQATLYRLSSGNEVARYDAVSYKYLDASGWHRSSEITDDIDAAIRMIEGLLYWGEGNPVDGNSVEYMEGKPIPNVFNIREDYMHTDEYPSEKEIAKKHLEMLREADERNDIKMPSLSYSNDVDNVEVSMRLAETIKGCYWKTYDDGSGSLRRLQTDTVILGYNLHPVDSGYDEYEDARGWHGFERSEDFRSALEKLVTDGIVSPMDHGAKDFDLRSNEFEQEEVRSMNMKPEEFLEEMRAYFAGEKEAMSTDSLVYIDHESGLGQTLLLSGIKGCYWHQIEDEVATLYRLSTGEKMCTCFAGERQEYRDRNGWHSILPDVDAPGESDDPTFNYISYTIEEMMQSLEPDIQAGDVIPMDKTAEEHFIELLKDYDQKNDTKKKPLRYHNEEEITVSMQLAKTMKGCYWKSFDDGSGSLRRLEGNSTILSYDATNSEYQDAAGWHGFERGTDFRLALEKLVTDGIASPMDNGSTMFDVRNDMSMEELNRILEEHEKWLRGEAGGKQANLSSISLQGVDLSGRNLARIRLSSADLYGANFEDANLQGAQLFSADLTNADLTNANLEKAGLAYANVQGANFKGANLQNSSLLETIGLEEAQGVSQDKLKEEIAALKDKIEQRELDNFCSDSWEQSAQIRRDIETLQSKLKNLTEFEKRQSAKRLFIDMDGTLAEFHPVDTMETLYEQGYFAQLAPHENVVNGIKTFMRENPDAEVFILSSVLTDSPYAQAEKNAWLDRYLPEIGMDNRIFASCGSAKNEFVPGGVWENDVLLDDYSKNLHEWPGKALKLMNGINGTKGSFQGEKISAEMPVAEFAARLASFCEGEEIDDMNMENKNIEKAEILQGCYWKTTESGVYLYRESNNQTIAIYQPPQNLISESGEHSLSPENIHPKRSIEAAVASGYILPMDGGERPKIRINDGTKKLMENQYYPFNDDWFSFFVNAETGERKFKLETSDVELLDKESAIKAEELKDAEIAASKESAVTPKMQTVFQMMNGPLTSNPQAAVEKREYGMQDVCKAELLYPVSNTENKVIKLTATQDAAQALSKYNEGDIITFVGIPTNDGYKICRMDDGTVFAAQQKMLYDFTMRGEIPENDRKRELALSDIKEGFKNLSYEEKFKLVLEEEVDCHDNEALKEELWETFRDNDSYLGFFGKDEVAELMKRRDKFLEINADMDKDGGMEV